MRASVIAGAHASPVELYSDVVLVPLVQEDPTIFIGSNLGGRTLQLVEWAVTHTHFIKKKQGCLEKGFF